MSEKIYPMNDHYKEGAARLLKLIEARDLVVKTLKIAPPEMIGTGQKMIADANRKIEEQEAALAQEYETYQVFCREKEKLETFMDGLEVGKEGAYIYIKRHLPDKLEIVEAVLFFGWNSEEIEAFYDRVAILEAAGPESIIADSDNS
jgi:hypothetical protein